jgi:hypothetical protein
MFRSKLMGGRPIGIAPMALAYLMIGYSDECRTYCVSSLDSDE